MTMKTAIGLVERGRAPEFLTRAGVRTLLRRNLREMNAGDRETRLERHADFLELMRSSPVAVASDEANRQHYELPAEFFRTVLGPELKYSACWWHRWRLFFLSCAEFFGLNEGSEWYVSHYLMQPRSAATARSGVVPITATRSQEMAR